MDFPPKPTPLHYEKRATSRDSQRPSRFNDVLSVLLLICAAVFGTFAALETNESARVNIGLWAFACILLTLVLRYGHKRI